MKINCGTICCDITVSEKFSYSIESGIRCEYPQDTIEYALRRFFSRNESIRKAAPRESLQMRLAKGRGRRPHYYTYCIPAKQLELPGSWAVVKLYIDNVGITVSSLKLSLAFPSSRADDRQQFRLCA